MDPDVIAGDELLPGKDAVFFEERDILRAHDRLQGFRR